MSPLSKEEILAQLEKIGIHSTSEAEFYFKDYKQYASMPDLRSFSPQVYQEESIVSYHKHGRGMKRISRTSHYVAPKIKGTLNKNNLALKKKR